MLASEYTLCTAEGELKLLCGPHTQMVHRVSQDAGSSHVPCRVPSGQPCQGCAAICSSGVVVLHSSLQLQISSDVFSLYKHVKAWSRTLEAWPRTLLEDPSYARCLLFLQPLSQHTMYLLVCKRVCCFFLFLRKSHSSSHQRKQLHSCPKHLDIPDAYCMSSPIREVRARISLVKGKTST